MSKKTGYFKRYAMTLLFPLGMYAVFALITLIIGNASFFTGYTTEGIIHHSPGNCNPVVRWQMGFRSRSHYHAGSHHRR